MADEQGRTHDFISEGEKTLTQKNVKMSAKKISEPSPKKHTFGWEVQPQAPSSPLPEIHRYLLHFIVSFVKFFLFN